MSSTATAARRHRHRRGRLQRPVRRRRRDHHRPAARALAGLRAEGGDRHVAGGDHPDRSARRRHPGASTATSTSGRASRSASPAHRGVVAGTALQQRHLRARRRRSPSWCCCSPPPRCSSSDGRARLERADRARLRRRAWRAASWVWAAASCSCPRWWCSPTSRSSAPRRPRSWRSCSCRVVGTWRQRGYGNVSLRDGLVIGALSPLGVLVGVVLANAAAGARAGAGIRRRAARLRLATRQEGGTPLGSRPVEILDVSDRGPRRTRARGACGRARPVHGRARSRRSCAGWRQARRPPW